MRKRITMAASDDITLKESYTGFIQQKQAMNVVKETVAYYDNSLKFFLEFMGEDVLCRDINEESIYAYILHLRETRETLSDRSINTYLGGIRTILYNLMEKGRIKPFKIKLIRAEKQLKETYTDEELEILLKKPDLKKESFSTYRNWVMICYLLGTGNRLRTLCNVKIGDVDFQTHEIRLKKVKNKKQYAIPLSKTLEKALREYLSYRKGESHDYLFCTQYGQQLAKEGVASAIDRYNHSRGVTKTSIHLFRHTFAKKWILNNGDIFRLQQILGHSTLDIVKEYVQMYGKDLQQDFEAFNPLDNMNTEIGRQKIDMKRK